MKGKRVIVWILAVLLVGLTACGDRGYNSLDGRPPVEDTLKELYSRAQECYDWFYRRTLPAAGDAIYIGGRPGYRLCSDARFGTLEELQAYALTCFTREFADTYLFGSSRYAESGGKLYVQPYEVENDRYAGHVFEMVGRTDTLLRVRAIVYCAVEPLPRDHEPFYRPPEDGDSYTTRTVDMELVMTRDGWRFDQFAGIYN